MTAIAPVLPAPVPSQPRSDVRTFLIKWTPRALAVLVGGYYGLGLAYGWGVMAAVDKLAIAVLKYYVGYVGVGALMPTFQWYAAWAVRFSFGIALGLIYDLLEKVVKYVMHRVKNCLGVPLTMGCRSAATVHQPA